MSASREKFKRKEHITDGTVSKVENPGMSKGLKTFLIVLCAVVVVAVVLFFTFVQNGFFASHSTAAVINGHNVSPVMLNYFYRDAYNQLSGYASYLGIDTEKPLKDQISDEETGATWADYFIEQGAATAANAYSLYDEAKANGYELDEQTKKELDDSMGQFDLYAASNGFSDVDSFIAAVYGNGCNLKNYREYAELVTTGSMYAEEVNKQFNYSDDQIEAEYQKDPKQYDGVSYRSLKITDEMVAQEGDPEGTDYTAAKKAKADELVASIGGNLDLFISAVLTNSKLEEGDELVDTSLVNDARYIDCPTVFADWLFDDARAENDISAFSDDTDAYVVMFLNRDVHDYPLPCVHHILVKVDDTTDEAAMAAAKEQAEAILAEYEAGEKTYDAFSALGEKYLADGTAAEAAAYNDIKPTDMVANFSSWCFDPNRTAGDTGVVETEYGYHVMYFIGTGRIYRNAMIDTELREADYNAWHESATAKCDYTFNSFGMKFVTK